MIEVQLLYFAGLKSLAQKEGETLIVDNGTTLAQLYSMLAAKYHFPSESHSIRPAMNASFCKWHDVLVDQAEVAFIPLVSGG